MTVPEQFRKAIEAEHVVLVEKEEPGVGGEWRDTVYGLINYGELSTGRIVLLICVIRVFKLGLLAKSVTQKRLCARRNAR